MSLLLLWNLLAANVICQVMAGRLCGREKSPLFLPYGKRFKDTRRLMQNYMNVKTAREHWRVQEEETTKFLHRLLHSPDKFKQHIKRRALL